MKLKYVSVGLILLGTVLVANLAVSAGSLTKEDYFACAAIAKLREDGHFNRGEFEYLMKFQEGYEASALGHETIMYRWKKKGERICLGLAAMNKKPVFPSDTHEAELIGEFPPSSAANCRDVSDDFDKEHHQKRWQCGSIEP